MFRMVQSHFSSPIGLALCLELRRRGYQWARCDAQGRTMSEMLGMISECRQAGLTPYVIVDQLEHVEALPAWARCEWRNEPDLALGRPQAIPPEHYAIELMAAAMVAEDNPVAMIGGPVVSNLNRRGYDYINAVIKGCGGALPENVFGAVHRYGDGTYEHPHRLNRWLPWG